MGRTRVSGAHSCGICLVPISHCRCWLGEFISVPWLHRPLCNPCYQPAFPGLLIPSKPLAPLPRGVLSLSLAGSHTAWTPNTPHIWAALHHPIMSHVQCSPISATAAEPSPSFGSLLRDRFQDLALPWWGWKQPGHRLFQPKNLPTHNFEGRREEYIQTKINMIVLPANRQKPKVKDAFFDPRQKTLSLRFFF